jgi:hypothetical protein
VDPHELERIRRSIAMLPPGHSAGALTREAAMALIEDLSRLDQLTAGTRSVDLARPPPVALGAFGVVVLGIPAGMDACPV